MAFNTGNLVAGAADSFEVDGTELGMTRDGVTVRRESDWLRYEVDQFIGIVKKSPTLVGMFVETRLAEYTLENLRLAFGAPTGALGSDSLQLFEPTGDEIEVLVSGPTIDGQTTRYWNMARCVPSADGEVKFMRGEPTDIPLNIEVLAETVGGANDRWGAVWDV